MSNKQYLIDSASKHQVFLQRYAGSEYKQMLKFINKVLKEAKVLVTQANLTNKARLEALIRDLTKITKAIYVDMSKGVKSNMVELAKYESDFTERLLNQAVEVSKKGEKLPFLFTTPNLNQLRSAAFTTIMDANPSYKGTRGLTVGEALSEFGTRKAGDLAQIVRVGFALGKTTAEIANDMTNIISTLHTRQAQTLSRTITNHVAAQSRNEFYSTNSEILVDYYTVVATLDDRTTFTCMALDGKTFPVDDFEAPPYHWNCRTTYIREVKPEYQVNITGVTRAAKGADGVEHVSSNTNFGSWIKTQPDSFQDEVLGKERAELLRAGMSIDKFVDKNYQPYTIDELRTKDNEHIFEKAGL